MRAARKRCASVSKQDNHKAPMVGSPHVISDERLNQYIDDLIAGRRDACSAELSRLLDEGTPIQEIYERLFRDSLYEVGRRWECGAIPIAVEHMATAITEELLAMVLPLAAARSPSGRLAVVSAASGEFHQLGARIVADTIELCGWEVHFVGAGAPLDELVRAVRDRKPDLLALSVSMESHLPNVLSAIERARAVAPRVPIVVGGRALTHDEPQLDLPGVRRLSSLDELVALVKGWPG